MIRREKIGERVVIKERIRTWCDFCEKEIVDENSYDWTKVTLEAREGSVYPEGDMTERQGFDCCLACWESTIFPAISALAKHEPYKHYGDEDRTK